MGNVFYFGWEAEYLSWLQSLLEGTLFQPMLVFLNNIFSFLGERWICICLIGLVYWSLDHEKGKRIALAFFASGVSNGMIKNIVCRLRPYQCLDDIKLLRSVGGYSFPSGHSANAASLYGSIAVSFRYHKILKWIAVIVPVLVAVSRNYLGAHWPTDVFAGLLQGTVCIWFVQFIFSKIRNEKVVYILLLLLGVPGMLYCKTTDYFAYYGMETGFVCAMLMRNKMKHSHVQTLQKRILYWIIGCLLYSFLEAVTGSIFALITASGFIKLILEWMRYLLLMVMLFGVYPPFVCEKITE